MTPDAAERRARALLDGSTPGEWAHYYDEDAGHPCVEASARSDHRSRWIVAEVRSESMANAALIAAAPDLARDVLSLADALRAAEARAVAAEGAIGLLSRTLGCESDDPAGVVREALDHIADLDVRATAAEEQRLAADARCAALAGAVRAYLDADRDWRRSRYMIAEHINAAAVENTERLSVERYAAWAALTALLRGAPCGYVPAGAVREYLRARDAHAMPRPEATTAALRDDVIAARTALDAALLAATTTPKESL